MDATAGRSRRAGAVLEVLGEFRLRHGTRAVELPASVQRLVALLALHGPADRRRVAGGLWPDSTEERAHGSLRSALWRLAQVAPDVVHADGDRLAVGPQVRLDRDRVQAACHVLLGPGPHLRDLPALPDRVELLPGWDEPWVVDERERLRQLLLHAMEARARLQLARGEVVAALDAALRVVAADPLRESAHALVVEVHLAEGNRVEGWRQVERCRAVLRAELGVDASPRLLRLAGVALGGSLAASAAGP